MTNTNKLEGLEWHNDGGHGWLKCPMTRLRGILDSRTISQYSFCFNDYGYFEEDCDAQKALEALNISQAEARNIPEVDDGERSKIRNYPRFNN